MSCTLHAQDVDTVRAGGGLRCGPVRGLLEGAAGSRRPGEAPTQALRIDASLSGALGESLRALAGRLGSVAGQLSTLSPHDAEATLTGTAEALIALARGLRSDRATPVNGRQTSIRLIVERFIEARLSSPDVTPDTIASDLDIPRATLYRAFADVGGVATYVQHRRLAIARSLLLSPEECRPIGEIASSLGFDNSAAFSKAFRRQYGRTPRGMRSLGGDLAATLRRKDGAVGDA